MKKRLLAICVLLCMLLALPMTAMAAQEKQMIHWVRTEQGKLTMLLVHQEENGAYSAALDGKELPMQGGDADRLPITLYCLVDVSGSISPYKMKLIQGTLNQLSQSMGGEDNMILATVDNTVTESGILTTQQDREKAIGAIAATQKDTNLYAGIVSGMERLASATDLNPVRALVVMSDGVDQQDNGSTEQEVLNAIGSSRLPVFTVALVEGYTERESAKVLGSFARNSCGGLSLTTTGEGSYGEVRRDIDGTEFGTAIWNAVNGSQCRAAAVTADMLDAGKAEMRLTVTYTTGNSSYTDSVLVNTAELMPEEVPTEETEPESTEPEPAEPKEDKKIYLIGGIGAGVLLVVIAVLVLLNGKKKEEAARKAAEAAKKAAEDTKQEAARAAKQAAQEAVRQAEQEAQLKKQAEEAQRKKQEAEERARLASQRPTYTVEMVDIPRGEHPCRFTLYREDICTFGRNGKSQNILDANDSTLSGKHFSLLMNKDQLCCVRDEGSQNGTYVNGIRVGTGWMKLESGDKLRAGGREYRLTIQ